MKRQILTRVWSFRTEFYQKLKLKSEVKHFLDCQMTTLNSCKALKIYRQTKVKLCFFCVFSSLETILWPGVCMMRLPERNPECVGGAGLVGGTG